MQFSITGIVYLPLTIALAIISFRFFLAWKTNRLREDICYAQSFGYLALVCLAGGLSGTVMTDSREIYYLVAGSMVPVTLANACLGYLFFLKRFPRQSPWIGFWLVALLGLVATVRSALGPVHPELEPSGGVNWGMSFDIALLRSLVYLAGMGPLTLVLIGDLRRAHQKSLITRDLFLVIFLVLAIALVAFDFIIEPLTGIKALYSEIVILIMGILGMSLYFTLYEWVLLKSQRKFKRLVENMLDMVCLTDGQGTIRYANAVHTTRLGYDVGDLAGRNFYSMVFDEDLDMVQERIRFNDTSAVPESFEFRLIRADGQPVWVETHGSFLLEHSEPESDAVGTAIVCRDVTERRMLESRLRQSQKMQAVGLLAGGVAHDFNNLLTVINGYSESIMEMTDRGSPVAESAEEILEAGRRAASLTRQLLAFSRKQILNPEVININLLVESMSRMLRRLIGEDIDYSTRLEPDLCSVKADPGQVEQVLLNLVVNARDALPGGGRISVETANISFDGSGTGFEGEPDSGQYVLLAVSDSGSGMDAETRERIFEPFYSTKPMGQGTGLGLSTAYGIVKQSQGSILVESEPDRGTTFNIYLPAVDGDPGVEPTGGPSLDLTGSEPLLVVEDDRALLDLTEKELRNLGYRTYGAGTGGDAQQLIDKHRETLRLMLVDVVLPDMSGRELAEIFWELCPSASVLFMSGYTDNAVVSHGVMAEGINFIQKPFTYTELARQIRGILDGD